MPITRAHLRAGALHDGGHDGHGRGARPLHAGHPVHGRAARTWPRSSTPTKDQDADVRGFCSIGLNLVLGRR
ncbi:MAG: hypothetical protein MZV63_65655 [Marinilabiliales bacterium]|nr:hypothetical protein [Marinilabiliales bacterium]